MSDNTAKQLENNEETKEVEATFKLLNSCINDVFFWRN